MATTTTPKVFLGGDDVRAVVVDCGSWATRFGSAGDDSPRVIFPSAVAYPHPRPAPAPPDVEMTDAQQQQQQQPPQPPTAHQPTQSSLTSQSNSNSQSSSLTIPPPRAGDIVLTAPTLFREVEPIYTHDLRTGDATIASWSHMTSVWRASYAALRLNPKDGPLLIVEPTRMWRARDRALALEAAFETLGVPAAYIARGSAMTAFAAARVSACVLDIGAQGATAVPVVDGYALQNATQRGCVGGAFLANRLAEWTESCLEERPDYDGRERGPGKRMRGDLGKKDRLLRATHEIRRERIPGDEVVRRYKVTDLTLSDKREFTSAHRQFYRLRVMDDLLASTVHTEHNRAPGTDQSGGDATTPAAAANGDGQKGKNGEGENNGGDADGSTGNDGGDGGGDAGDDANGTSASGGNTGGSGGTASGEGKGESREYTLPDGNVLSLGERNNGGAVGELLFGAESGPEMRSVSELVADCIGRCDVDLRRDLWGGVVVSGGCSLVGGVVERVARELAVRTPQTYKLKMSGAGTGTERANAAWIGGSIMSSLGTFHNAWVSRAEYDEFGAANALRKCP